jgi:hypothetical protein
MAGTSPAMTSAGVEIFEFPGHNKINAARYSLGCA